MFSRPVAVRPAYSGRRGLRLQRDARCDPTLLVRVRRSLLCALSLYLSFVIVSTAGETGTDALQPVNLFVDVSDNRLPGNLEQQRRLSVAGVPIVFEGKRQDGEAARSIAAGLIGGHRFDLGDHLSLQPTGLVSRTHTDGDGILSTGRLGGDLELQYQNGGSGLLLRPSAYASMQKDVLAHMDYALDSKVWQAIGWGVNLTGTLGHARHESEQISTDDRDSSHGSLGLSVGLFDQSLLELTYGFNTTKGPLASQFRFDQGPTVATHLNLASGWRLDGSYGLTATERGYTDEDADARRHDMRHHVRLQSDWAISSSTGAEWHVYADYDYEQTFTDAPIALPAIHIGSVNFALNF
jgi:hypothetical protein